MNMRFFGQSPEPSTTIPPVGRLRHGRLLVLLLVATVARAERLPLRSFTAADGLAGDTVNTLAEDPRGYLWIGTATGLSRFDGYGFTNYGSAEGLPHPDVTALLVGRDGTLWAGTRNGLARLREDVGPATSSFELIPLGEGEAKLVSSILEGSEGELWVGCRGGFFRLTEEIVDGHRRWLARSEPLPVPAAESGDWRFRAVRALARGAEGTLYVGTARGLYVRRPGGDTVHYSIAPEAHQWDPVRDLEVDDAGVLWMAHDFGVFALRPPLVPASESTPLIARAARGGAFTEPWHPPRELGDISHRPIPVSWQGARQVVAISRGRGDRLWAATPGNLLRYDDGTWRVFDGANGLGGQITDVLEDSTGNTWIGTENHGIERLAAGGLVSYGRSDGLLGTRIASVFESRDGTLMVYVGGGERQYLHRFDGQRFVDVTPRAHLAVRAHSWGWNHLARQDRGGEWWLPTSEGLQRFPAVDPRALDRAELAHRYGPPEGLPSLDVFRLFEDSRGDFWLGLLQTPTPLARSVRGTGRFEALPLPANVELSCPSAFVEDRAGHVWMGLYLGGLVRWDPAVGARGFPVEGEMPAGFVHALLRDRRGRIWVATSGGLARIDDPEGPAPRISRVVLETGLGRDGVRALAEDAAGSLYLGSGRGLDRLDPQTGRVRSFTTGDGLANSVVQTLFEDRHGQIWVGTLDGLSRFDPARVRRAAPPRVLLTGLFVAGIPHGFAGPPRDLELAPAGNRLQVDFAGVGLASEANLRFQTRVLGLDPEWSPPSPNRSVLLAGLPPGSYRFEVRALTGAGELSPQPAAVGFRVLPPLWRRGWFLGSAFVVLVGAGWGVRRARQRRRQEISGLRGRIAADLHDDVGASLSRIGVLAELGRRRLDAPAESRETTELLTEIGETSQELSDTLSDIVWALDPGRHDLDSLVSRLRRFASDLLESRGIALEFSAPGPGEAPALTPAESRELYLLVKEAIHNAARHARPGKVAVRLEVTARRLSAEVADDGIGLPAIPAMVAAKPSGHGLRTLRLRADLLGGELTFESRPGAGTTVRLVARRPPWRRLRPLWWRSA
jgi:signal transduction histidine kinase/ligand-binding sensor domain-containing protein